MHTHLLHAIKFLSLSIFQAVLPVLLAIGGISAQCLMGNDVPALMDPASKTLLTDARYAFALDSLKKTALIESRDNIFFSPHSLHQALSLAYFGARGTTAESLKKALRIPDQLSKVDVQRYYAFERSLNEMRSEVSNYSGAIAQPRRFIPLSPGMSRQIARDLSLHR